MNPWLFGSIILDANFSDRYEILEIWFSVYTTDQSQSQEMCFWLNPHSFLPPPLCKGRGETKISNETW